MEINLAPPPRKIKAPLWIYLRFGGFLPGFCWIMLPCCLFLLVAFSKGLDPQELWMYGDNLGTTQGVIDTVRHHPGSGQKSPVNEYHYHFSPDGLQKIEGVAYMALDPPFQRGAKIEVEYLSDFPQKSRIKHESHAYTIYFTWLILLLYLILASVFLGLGGLCVWGLYLMWQTSSQQLNLLRFGVWGQGFLMDCETLQENYPARYRLVFEWQKTEGNDTILEFEAEKALETGQEYTLAYLSERPEIYQIVAILPCPVFANGQRQLTTRPIAWLALLSPVLALALMAGVVFLAVYM